MKGLRRKALLGESALVVRDLEESALEERIFDESALG
jgi:hypothetical protein